MQKENYRVAIPAERLVLAREQRPIDQLDQQLPAVTQALNNALAELEKLELGEFSIQEVSHAMQGVNSLDNQVRERITENKPQTIGKMVFSAEAVKKMVEVPDLSAANAALSSLKHALEHARKQPGDYLQGTLVLPNFEITGFTASFKEEARQKLVDRHSIYAESDGEKEVALVMSEIVERLQYLGEKYKLHPLKDRVLEQTNSEHFDFALNVNHARLKKYMDHFEGRNKYPLSW